MQEQIKIQKKHPFLRFIILLLAVLIPLPLLVAAPFFLPNVYGETMMGALAPKLERLRSIEGDKLVIVGGSSVAFGIDSAMLEEYTGYEVVNFGLYAALGTKIMLDLSLPEIEEGDVVILAPELDSQTLSMYFNGEVMWQAANSDISLLSGISPKNYTDMLLSYPKYLSSVLPHALSGTAISPEGIYRSDSFNAYGDISYPREHNVMAAGYDVNSPVSLTPELFQQEFIDYLNRYIDEARKKGATVYYTFSPVNKSALTDETDSTAIEEFYKFTAESLNCPVISDLRELIMHENYFYDTNFHLNDAGVRVRTAYLIADLRRASGITQALDIELPSPPDRPQSGADSDWKENEWSSLFVYESFGDGLKIVGVREDARGLTALEIPYMADGKAVVAIARGAFSNCKSLTELTVYENLSFIENGAFSGADALEKLHVRRESSDDLEVGGELFDGAPDSLKIHLYTDTSYHNFISGYWWAVHSGRMIKS